MSLLLAAGLTSRRLTLADVPITAALIRACEQHFVGEAFIDEADVTGMWLAPTLDLATDSLGIFQDELLVALAVMDDRRQVMAEVRPTHLRRGLGASLLGWLDQHARTKGLSHAEQEITAADAAGAALLAAGGYTRAHDDWVLRLDEGAEIVHHVLPDDVTIGRFDEADARAVHRVITDAFAEWQTVPPRSYGDWRVVIVDREGVDTDHFRVARAGGEVVGVAIVHDSDVTTWVPQLAVRADRRRQGIAQELLAEAFEAGRRRGCATSELSTSALSGALTLYQRLGMRIVAEFQTWEKVF